MIVLVRKVLLISLLLVSIYVPGIIHIDSSEKTNNMSCSEMSQKLARKWTFMVYLDGDNDLESAAIDDFLEMSNVGSTDNVSIIVLFDRWNGTGSSDDTSYGDWTDARIFYITTGLEPYDYKCNESWGEVNMGDPETLFRFINYSVRNYPADHYALIIWDHGLSYQGTCLDQDSGNDILDLYELREALEEANQKLGVSIDVLGFDACIMGMLEVAYSVRNYVKFVVFSQEAISEYGWPYDAILGELVSNSSMTPRYLSVVIVDEYISFYSSPFHPDTNATLSAINVTATVIDVFPRLNRLVGYLLRFYSIYGADIEYAMNNAEVFWYYWIVDLEHFLRILKNRVSNTTLIGLIDDTINAIEGSVVHRGNLTEHRNAYGLSIYLPAEYRPDYVYIESSIHQQWDEFVRKIADRDPGVWFYDIRLNGTDDDGDGFLDSDIYMYLDLDTENMYNLTIRVYGTSGGNEYFMGFSRENPVSGANSDDTISIQIGAPSKDIYDLRVEVYDTNGVMVNSFYYYCDMDIIGVKLNKTEYMPDDVPPSISVLYPENNSVINKLEVTFVVNISDNVKVDKVLVYVNGSLKYQFDTIIYNFTIQFESYGTYVITIKAIDTTDNMNSVSVVITISKKTTTLPTTEWSELIVNFWIGAIIVGFLLFVAIFIMISKK